MSYAFNPKPSEFSDSSDHSASIQSRTEEASKLAEVNECYQALQQHNRWLSELGETTDRMHQQESVDSLLQFIAEEMVNVSCANGAYMHMVHETGDYLDILAVHGPLSDYLLQDRRYKGVGLSAKVWDSGIAHFAPDYNNHPDCVLELNSNIQAACLPLSFAGKVLGVVFITAEVGVALEDDLDLLKQVATIASRSIHHANQRECFARELYRMQTLSLISAAILQYHKWDELASHVCPKLFDALDLTRVSLYFNDSSSGQLETYACWERIEHTIELCEPMKSTLVNETVCAWCFSNKKPAQINRAVKDERESEAAHAFREEKNIGSTLCAPIFSENTVWGVLIVCRGLDQRNFDESDVNTLNTVVGQMSIALQHQQLLDEVQNQAQSR